MTIKMTLALADERDFRDLWKLYRLTQQLDQASFCDKPELRERRCRWALSERAVRIQSALIRIGMGCEMMIKAVCDQSKPHYALKSELGAAEDLLKALKEIVSQIDQGGSDGKVFARDYCITAARAAIAKATGDDHE